MNLNRPKAINALTLEMVESLYKILDTWRANSKVSLIIILGEGTKGYVLVEICVPSMKIGTRMWMNTHSVSLRQNIGWIG